MASKDTGAAEAAPVDDVATALEPTLVAKIAAAMAEAGQVTKSETADQGSGGRYKYASAEAILKAVREPLLSRGVILVPRPTTYTETEIRSSNNKVGTRIVLDVEFAFTDGVDELVRPWRGEGQDYGDKAYGKAYTNAIKTFIRSAWLLPTEHDDPEGSDPGERTAPGTPAALPAWATFLTNDRVRAELAPPLTAALGEERGRAVYLAVKNSLGGAPAVLAPFMRLIVDELLEASPDDLVIRQAAEKKRRRDEAAHAEKAAADARAKADADAAAAAAEAPDPPAPEPDGGPYGADGEGEDLSAELAAHAEAIPSAGADVIPEGPPAPAAGSIMPPDVSGLNGLEAIDAYRERGCKCDDPLTTDDKQFNTDCPIKGHGIPF